MASRDQAGPATTARIPATRTASTPAERETAELYILRDVFCVVTTGVYPGMMLSPIDDVETTRVRLLGEACVSSSSVRPFER